MNSFSYLETKGKLPAVPAQYAEADWSDPEVAKQPGVKERVELVNYMAKENAQRESLGLPKMSPLEAHAELQNKALEEAQTQRTQKQADLRKKRGAMISGQSAPAPGKTRSFADRFEELCSKFLLLSRIYLRRYTQRIIQIQAT